MCRLIPPLFAILFLSKTSNHPAFAAFWHMQLSKSSYQPHEEGGPNSKWNGSQCISPQHNNGTFTLTSSKQLSYGACTAQRSHELWLRLNNNRGRKAKQKQMKKLYICSLTRMMIKPMFIAGGTANCSKRTNWYSGFSCTKPKRNAPLTMTIPIKGRAI